MGMLLVCYGIYNLRLPTGIVGKEQSLLMCLSSSSWLSRWPWRPAAVAVDAAAVVVVVVIMVVAVVEVALVIIVAKTKNKY